MDVLLRRCVDCGGQAASARGGAVRGGSVHPQYFAAIMVSILASAQLEAATVVCPESLPTRLRPPMCGSVCSRCTCAASETPSSASTPLRSRRRRCAATRSTSSPRISRAGSSFVLPTARAMCALLGHQYNARVRAAATSIVPLLLKSVVLGFDGCFDGEDCSPCTL